MADAAPAALMLLGPTGSGKSALAMALAQHVPLEIVSVDSAQVYRGLDIGSAKPTPAERAAVPHHLIDIRDPAQRYSAAEFARDAASAVADIRRRGRLPLLVGGTMLYAKALREGLAELPSADAALRAELTQEAVQRGWPALHARLAQLDAAAAARIERRFDAMLAAGFLDEVHALRARGDLAADLPALRSVGYRQAWDFLAGHGTHDEFRAAAIAATRRLAKRQLTWLRSLRVHETRDPLVDDVLPLLQAAAAEALQR